MKSWVIATRRPDGSIWAACEDSSFVRKGRSPDGTGSIRGCPRNRGTNRPRSGRYSRCAGEWTKAVGSPIVRAGDLLDRRQVGRETALIHLEAVGMTCTTVVSYGQ